MVGLLRREACFCAPSSIFNLWSHFGSFFRLMSRVRPKWSAFTFSPTFSPVKVLVIALCPSRCLQLDGTSRCCTSIFCRVGCIGCPFRRVTVWPLSCTRGWCATTCWRMDFTMFSVGATTLKSMLRFRFRRLPWTIFPMNRSWQSVPGRLSSRILPRICFGDLDKNVFLDYSPS